MAKNIGLRIAGVRTEGDRRAMVEGGDAFTIMKAISDDDIALLVEDCHNMTVEHLHIIRVRRIFYNLLIRLAFHCRTPGGWGTIFTGGGK